MQKNSKQYFTFAEVEVYKDIHLEGIRRHMENNWHDVANTLKCLEDICKILHKHVLKNISSTTPYAKVVPIFILRGGLIMLHAWESIFNKSPLGIVISYRKSVREKPHIIYGDIPYGGPNGIYLVNDLIVASGATMVSTLETVSIKVKQRANDPFRVIIVAPFCTETGIEAILNIFADAQIKTIWHQEQINSNFRIPKLHFDAGDYALGGASGQRIQWANRHTV
jgi:uracil phosphoribosyltransferase